MKNISIESISNVIMREREKKVCEFDKFMRFLFESFMSFCELESSILELDQHFDLINGFYFIDQIVLYKRLYIACSVDFSIEVNWLDLLFDNNSNNHSNTFFASTECFAIHAYNAINKL